MLPICAVKLGIPVLAVIDAGSMAGTFRRAWCTACATTGRACPGPGCWPTAVASEGHEKMLQASVRDDDLGVEPGGIDAGWLGGLRRDAGFALPERHLGLTVASELPDALARLDALADAMAATPLGQLDAQGLQRWAVPFEPAAERPVAPLLQGRTVAVARDTAFCFTYPANLDTLRALGAGLVFFSPVADEPVPDCDAVWLPGGYPELHADALVNGTRCRGSLAAHIAAGKPVWAECGGMMPLFDGLTLADGARVPMWGLLPGEVAMQPRLAALGPQRWDTAQGELRWPHLPLFADHLAAGARWRRPRRAARSAGPRRSTARGRCGRATSMRGLLPIPKPLRNCFCRRWHESRVARTATHRLPDRGNDRVAVPAGAGGAHRRHQRLHRAAAPGARGEAQGQRVSQRQDRQDPGTAARLRVRFLRPAGRHRGGDSIRAGVQVTVFNQRSVEEVFSMLYQVAAMVGCADEGLARIAVMRQRLEAIRAEVGGAGRVGQAPAQGVF